MRRAKIRRLCRKSGDCRVVEGDFQMNTKEVEASYPLSSMQQGMMLHSLHEVGAYIQQMTCDLKETLDPHALLHAWQQVLQRHEILRTAFRWEGIPEPIQEVYKAIDLTWRNEDWSHLPSELQQQEFENFLVGDRKKGFDVTKPPLMRLAHFKLADTHHRLVWTFHHALLDGRSHFAVLQEVFALYDAWVNGDRLALDTRRPYGDYIQWLQEQEWSSARDFWRKSLRGFKPPPHLRIGEFLESSLKRDRRSESQSHRLSEELTTTLKLIAQQNEITLNTMVQASWALLLSRYYGSQDIVFGVTRACRHSTLPESESMVGFFINTLPLRVEVDPQRPLVEWLKELRQQQIVFRDYEHTPLAKIQEWSEARRGKSIFETVLVFENYELNEQVDRLDRQWRGRHFELLEQTHYPLTLAAYSGTQLLLKLEYDERRFDAPAIQAMLGHLATLLKGMATDLNRRVGQLSMLSEGERQQLLLDWNQSSRSQGSGKCLHEIFSEQAKRTPEATAVVFGDEQLSFAELDARGTQLAQYLERFGVGPEVLVAICVERSLEMIVGMLGIIKAGGAYLALDPSYPADRLSFMLNDSGASVILTQQSMRDRFASQHPSVICLDSDWKDVSCRSSKNIMNAHHIAAAVSPLNLAYVIYTSGSTGQPKGVMVTHENVVRLFETTKSLFGFDHNDVWTMFHSYAFDFSVWEMWGALLYGGLLVVVPYLISRAPKKFYQLLRAAKVTVLNQTPSAFRQLVEAASADRTNDSGNESSLRLVIFGGEALDTGSVNRWFDQHDDKQPQLVNMYGITETTVHVTHHLLKAGESRSSGRSRIGRPLDDLQVYILDQQQEPLPVGVAGEMYVGGAGLSRGYLNRPDLTAERFLPHPFSEMPGERLYRTGDIARFLRSGDIEYLGRRDRQVKIRGFRIELAEIESCLARHPAVRDCAVMLREDRPGLKNLVAYVVTRSEQTTTKELRSFLTGKLPDYMLPAVFVRLEQLPLTENGKLDRNALTAPLDESAEGEVVPPRNATEEIVASIWSEVLGVARVSVQQDFFELGGDSLTATQVISRINLAFQIDLPLGVLFEHRTVAGLAPAIEEILVDELSRTP
jgi:amino acid adenylation domain-containing protein